MHIAAGSHGTEGVLYLAGGYELAVDARLRDDVGYMLEPRMGRRICLSWVPFAIDNGCFSTSRAFDAAAFMRDLEHIRTRYLAQCLFAVAPDVVGDAVRTLARSIPFMPRIRSLGYQVAFVSQDDADLGELPWDMFDVLFVGGSDAWKDSERSWALCAEASRRGKRIHVGRVNGYKRLRECVARGYVESVDGTMLNYHPTVNWEYLGQMLDAAAVDGPRPVRARR